MLGETRILGVRVDPTSYEMAASQVEMWARNKESRYVCVANVHMIMEAYDSLRFKKIVNAADLVTPDGMPLVWALRRLGYPKQERVYGPDLTLHLLKVAALQGLPVGFYGGSANVLQGLLIFLKENYPSLEVRYYHDPPFRELTVQEDEAVIRDVNASECRILFIGLGCPKQEHWMAQHRGKIQAVMIGVGAAFDFFSGAKRQAPVWMQMLALEWLFRLIQEPKRLWRRYLHHNPRFAILIVRQILLQGR